MLGKNLLTIDIYERASGLTLLANSSEINPMCIMIATIYKENFFQEIANITPLFKQEDFKEWTIKGNSYLLQGLSRPYVCAFNEILQSKKNPYYADERNRDVF
jgi:hypothetical protein